MVMNRYYNYQINFKQDNQIVKLILLNKKKQNYLKYSQIKLMIFMNHLMKIVIKKETCFIFKKKRIK